MTRSLEGKSGRYRRGLVAAASVTAIAAGLTACGSDGSSDTSTSAKKVVGISVQPKTLAVIDVAGGSQQENAAKRIAQQAAANLGWKFIYVDGQGDPQKITQGAQSIVTQQPDALISLSVEASQMRQQLQALKAKGVPTCEAGGGQKTDPLFSLQIGEDEEKLGALMGDAAGKASDAPEVIMLANPQNYAGVAREAGFVKGLKAANPKAKVVFRQVIDFADPAGSAKKAVQSGLAKYPNATAIYPVFDFSFQPALQVVKQKGAKAKIFGNYTSETTTPQLRDASSPLESVGDVDNIKGVAICIDQFLQQFQQDKPVSADALAETGGLKYNVVDKQNVDQLMKPGQTAQYLPDALLAPYLAKWTKEYPATN